MERSIRSRDRDDPLLLVADESDTARLTCAELSDWRSFLRFDVGNFRGEERDFDSMDSWSRSTMNMPNETAFSFEILSSLENVSTLLAPEAILMINLLPTIELNKLPLVPQFLFAFPTMGRLSCRQLLLHLLLHRHRRRFADRRRGDGRRGERDGDGLENRVERFPDRSRSPLVFLLHLRRGIGDVRARRRLRDLRQERGGSLNSRNRIGRRCSDVLGRSEYRRSESCLPSRPGDFG